MRSITPCLIGVLLCSGAAWAWGPVTHARLAMSITESMDRDIVWGAMTPDFGSVLSFANPTVSSQIGYLTHNEFFRLRPSRFAYGFTTHNSPWGADYYAHLVFNPSAEEIFSSAKIRQLATEFGLPISRGEDIFEMAIDCYQRLERGPSFGVFLEQIAKTSGYQWEQDLVDAFALRLSERVSGLSQAQAEQHIRNAYHTWRFMVQTLGQALQKDESALFNDIAPILASYMGCSTEQAAMYLERGLEVCSDYEAEMERVAQLVQEDMRLNTEYQLPLSAYAELICAIFACLTGLAAIARLGHRPDTQIIGAP